MRYMSLVLVAFLMSGCISKLAENEAEKTLDYGMTNSKKVEIKNSETSRTIITMTYLNPIAHDLITQESEKFVVGTYVTSKTGTGTPATLSKFLVNGSAENVSVTPLAADAEVLKLIPSTNAWAKYVLVQAPKTEKLKMELSFENDRSEKVLATFQKDY